MNNRNRTKKTDCCRNQKPRNRKCCIEELESREMLDAGLLSVLDDLFITPAPMLGNETVFSQSYDRCSATVSSTGVAVPSKAAAPYGAGVDATSEYMIGSVYVTLVLMESDGTWDENVTDWTSQQIVQVKSEVEEGLQWWEDTFASNNPYSWITLDFIVDTTWADSPFETKYEPIIRGSDSETLWAGEFLSAQGYTGDYSENQSHLADLRLFNDKQRNYYDTDWAMTIFVVNSRDEANKSVNGGFFQDNTNSLFAYAWIGGPDLVMTYDNGNWGIDNMSIITAHETGHIFWARDEYPGADKYTTTSGYYNVQNVNAITGHPNPSARVPSIMADGEKQTIAYKKHISSPSSLEMLGWYDSDGDGIFDVLDVPMSLTGSGNYIRATSTFYFNGLSTVATLPNMNQDSWSSQEDITLNTVDLLEYKIDDGIWMTIEMFYGGTSDVHVAADIDLSDLSDGWHTIVFRTFCERTGATSIEKSFTFAAGTPVGTDIDNSVPNTVTVFWADESLLADEVLQYKNTNSSTWMTWYGPISDEGSIFSTTITGLKAGIYDFRLGEYEKTGIVITNSSTTAPTPLKPKASVVKKGENKPGIDSIMLNWRDHAKVTDETNARYVITCSVKKNRRWEIHEQFTTSLNEYHFTGLEQGTSYRFTITAVNAQGTQTNASGKKDIAVNVTAKTAKYTAVQKLKLNKATLPPKGVSANTAALTWIPSKALLPADATVHYEILMFVGRNKIPVVLPETITATVSESGTSAWIEGLSAGMRYKFAVREIAAIHGEEISALDAKVSVKTLYVMI